MESSKYATKSLDHLGLISVLCQKLGVAKFIDEKVPNQSAYRHISYGELLVAMILNGLGFVSRTLHMVPDYFSDKPVERLIGAGIKAEHINDDALGRLLDKLYEIGVSELYQGLSEQVVSHLGLSCDLVHLDATSFHVDGAYVPDMDSKGVRLTKGYSRDHRPDLNQVILNLITENQAGIPVYMQACSGNTNDSESFKLLVKSHIKSLKAAQRSQYFIGDSALYVAETICALNDQNKFFITRFPQHITEAKTLLKEAGVMNFTPLENGYSAVWCDNIAYAGVKQKWLLVKSDKHQSEKIIHWIRTYSKIHSNRSKHLKSFANKCLLVRRMPKMPLKNGRMRSPMFVFAKLLLLKQWFMQSLDDLRQMKWVLPASR